jgi:hypothetical protein
MTARDRETTQLLLVARHYIRSARRLVRRDESILRRTVQEITEEHNPSHLGRAELFLAHLASAATRLCTVCEKHKRLCPDPYRHFYKRKKRKLGVTRESIIREILANLQDHIHFLLRDNVGHMEDAADIAKDRWDVLKQLTMRQVLECLSKSYEQIHKAL